MGTGFIIVCILIGLLDGCARLAACSGISSGNTHDNVSMGHHYQRDVVFKDMMGM